MRNVFSKNPLRAALIVIYLTIGITCICDDSLVLGIILTLCAVVDTIAFILSAKKNS